MNSIVSTVEVQHKLSGRLFKAAAELFEDDPMHEPGFFKSGAVFHSAQGRTTAQFTVALRGAQPQQVFAQAIVIICGLTPSMGRLPARLRSLTLFQADGGAGVPLPSSNGAPPAEPARHG